MSLAQREQAVQQLVTSPHFDVAAFLQKLADDFPLACRILFTTHDPRASPSKMPFRLWDYEIKLAWCLNECIRTGNSVLIEKSRDVGVTWVVLAVLLHHWLFDDDFHALITSRKRALVDGLDKLDTLMDRMRLMIRYMPAELRTLVLPDWDERRYSPLCKMINPANSNSITGEAPVSDFGRQGRYTCVFYDEAASIANLAHIRASAGDSSRCHIYASTPKGMDNEFYRLRTSGEVRVLTVHWSVHPIKSEGLYYAGR